MAHFTLFQKYRFGTTRGGGPPCSGGRGSPSCDQANSTSSSSSASRGRFAVYAEGASINAWVAAAVGPAAPTMSRNGTPSQVLSSFDHPVTQWMSEVTVTEGSARNWPQVHPRVGSPARVPRNRHEAGSNGG